MPRRPPRGSAPGLLHLIVAVVGLSLGALGPGPSVSAATADSTGAAAARDSAAAGPTAITDAAVPRPVVHLVRWDDAITPVTRSVVADALDDARAAGAAALILSLDTPGGLLDATRDIVSDLLDSPLPVLVWVGPSGARAASAGTFITMAAHVAAMAPGTNIGAASPVTMGGGGMDSTMASKMFNDTAAFVRTLAERRGRNAEWAERAVRDAVSITETEAVELDVVDLVARDPADLVAQADGRVVETPGGSITLALAGAIIEEREIPLRYRILAYLVNPNVVYILMILGIYGLFFELQNPGAILPGAVGALCLILALYSMQTLPMNLAGMLLMVLGVVLFILEFKITSFGFLTLGGIACSLLGAMMLFESPEPALRASLSVVLPVTLVTAAVFLVAVGLSVRTLRSRPTTGAEGLVGMVGTVRAPLAPRGRIEVHGELWSAALATGEAGPVEPGAEVEVVAVHGLRLEVRRRRAPGSG